MKIGVVILNYKVLDQVLKCIQSVKDSNEKNLDIIVVDNDSGDGSGEVLKNQKDIIFIQNDVNSGYSGGNNIGIKRALSYECDFIFVLNPDTTVEKDTVRNLIAGMAQFGADLVSPKIYFEDGKTIWYAGSQFDRANVLGSHRGVDELDQGQYDQPIETDGITGGAFVAKREVFEKIGLFDERYFLYYEDADFSERAKAAGFKIMYIPNAVVFHKNAQSTGLGSPLQDYYITRNRMLYASKFLPFRTRFALFREAIRNIGNPVRRLALKDFLVGNFGKGSYHA